MKKLSFIILFLLPASYVFAQFEDDILRFSRITNQGTARSAAMGGAFGALGGDLSSASGNPAGIGVFRKSELNFTPVIGFSHSKSDGRSADKNAFQISNMGFVLSLHRNNSDWKGFNMAFNYTNLNNFNRTLDQTVWDSENSLLDVYVYDANGKAPSQLDNFSTGLAYDTYLIDTAGLETQYETALYSGDIVDQYKYCKEKGYQGEYAFSFGTNYKDILYLGATLGVQSFSYKMSSVYSEFMVYDSPSGLLEFHKPEYLDINGSGVNMKFGLIYRPIPQLRFGAAIHTPTWYNIDYKFRTYIDASFSDATNNSDEYINEREVDMTTPWRAILSVATVLGQRFILSADYEYVDYAYARYNDPNDYADFHFVNRTIESLYRGASNVRVGAECRINSTFSLRGGYSYMQSPYKEKGYSFVNSIPGGDKLESISGGIGLNFGHVYCDASFTHTYGKDNTVFYFLDGDLSARPINNKYTHNQARVSVGVRF